MTRENKIFLPVVAFWW